MNPRLIAYVSIIPILPFLFPLLSPAEPAFDALSARLEARQREVRTLTASCRTRR